MKTLYKSLKLNEDTKELRVIFFKKIYLSLL